MREFGLKSDVEFSDLHPIAFKLDYFFNKDSIFIKKIKILKFNNGNYYQNDN